MKTPLQIAFLPIWGKLNETIPRQQMAALEKMGLKSGYGLPGTVFPLFRTCLAFRPRLISLDWIHQYTLSPGLAASLVKSLLFILDVWATRLVFNPVLVWTLHNLQHHDPRPRKIERLISRFFALNCIKIRILGKGEEQKILDYLGVDKSRLEVIPEGPYIGWYPEGIPPAEARSGFGLEEGQRMWLYLGTIRPYKGVEQLIEAFTDLSDPDLRLFIAGNPWNEEYAQSLTVKAAADPRIRFFLKAIPDADLQRFFAAADLVVLPFRHVLNSGSVLLAMGFGKPVVAPSIGLIPFRLSAQTGLLFGPEKSLQAVLEEARKMDAKFLKETGEENRRQALRYSWDDFARFLNGLLEKEGKT
jgi:beta-1,4-mannosyltransferase